MKSLIGFLGILATVGSPSSSVAHVGAIARDATQHSQAHLIETSVIVLVVVVGAFIYLWRRRQRD